MFTFEILLRLWTCRVAGEERKSLRKSKKTSLDNNDRREGKNVQQWMRDKIYCFTTHGAIHSALFCLGQMRGSAFYVSKPLFWTKIILQSCKLSPIESSLCDMYPVD